MTFVGLLDVERAPVGALPGLRVMAAEDMLWCGWCMVAELRDRDRGQRFGLRSD